MSRYYPVAREGGAQPQYGEKRPRIGRRTIYLDKARDGEEVNIGGDVLWVVRASSYNALIEVAIHNQDQGQVPFQKGTFVRCGPFSQIFLFNEPQAAEWVEILYARETWDFTIQNPGSTFDTVQTVTPTELDTDTDVNVAANNSSLIKGKNNNRETIIVQSHPDNTNRTRVGPSSVGSNQGIILDPGSSATLNVCAPIYAYNVNDSGDGSDVVICFIEENE